MNSLKKRISVQNILRKDSVFRKKNGKSRKVDNDDCQGSDSEELSNMNEEDQEKMVDLFNSSFGPASPEPEKRPSHPGGRPGMAKQWSIAAFGDMEPDSSDDEKKAKETTSMGIVEEGDEDEEEDDDDEEKEEEKEDNQDDDSDDDIYAEDDDDVVAAADDDLKTNPASRSTEKTADTAEIEPVEPTEAEAKDESPAPIPKRTQSLPVAVLSAAPARTKSGETYSIPLKSDSSLESLEDEDESAPVEKKTKRPGKRRERRGSIGDNSTSSERKRRPAQRRGSIGDKSTATSTSKKRTSKRRGSLGEQSTSTTNTAKKRVPRKKKERDSDEAPPVRRIKSLDGHIVAKNSPEQSPEGRENRSIGSRRSRRSNKSTRGSKRSTQNGDGLEAASTHSKRKTKTKSKSRSMDKSSRSSNNERSMEDVASNHSKKTQLSNHDRVPVEITSTHSKKSQRSRNQSSHSAKSRNGSTREEKHESDSDEGSIRLLERQDSAASFGYEKGGRQNPMEISQLTFAEASPTPFPPASNGKKVSLKGLSKALSANKKSPAAQEGVKRVGNNDDGHDDDGTELSNQAGKNAMSDDQRSRMRALLAKASESKAIPSTAPKSPWRKSKAISPGISPGQGLRPLVGQDDEAAAPPKSPAALNGSGNEEGDDYDEDNPAPSMSPSSKIAAFRNVRRITKTGSKWDAMRSSRTAIDVMKKGAMFSKLFDDKDKLDATGINEEFSGPAKLKTATVQEEQTEEMSDSDDEDPYVEESPKEVTRKQSKTVNGRNNEQPLTTKAVDRRLAAIEEFERTLAKERSELEEAKEAIAFERESLELQLDEEMQRNDAMKQRIEKLEEELELERERSGGNLNGSTTSLDQSAVLTAELETLKSVLRRERRNTETLLHEKDEEIEQLKESVRSSKSNTSSSRDISSVPGTKSVGQLQGELVQTVSKLRDSESVITRQNRQIADMKIEMARLSEANGYGKLQKEISELRKQRDELQTLLKRERQQSEKKIRGKDETTQYLMDELAKLKKENSERSLQLDGGARKTQSMHQALGSWLDRGSNHNNVGFGGIGGSLYRGSNHGSDRSSISSRRDSGGLSLSEHGGQSVSSSASFTSLLGLQKFGLDSSRHKQ